MTSTQEAGVGLTGKPAAAEPSRQVYAALSLLVVVCLTLGLGSWPLFDQDEGRNAEVSREMAETNDYVLPHLNGLPYLDKPILYFALDALSIEVFGSNEFAARFPSMLMTLATAMLTFWFGRRLFSASAGALAALMFAASPLAIAFARIVIFDSMLTFFIVLATIAFYLGVESEGKDAKRWSMLAWVAIALGILTKGPVALALPLLVMLPYAAWRRRKRAIWSTSGFGLFLLIVFGWVALVSIRIPDFLHYALVVETYKRLTTKELQRTGPIWYFVPYLIGGAFPWSLALFTGWRRKADATPDKAGSVEATSGSRSIPSEARNQGEGEEPTDADVSHSAATRIPRYARNGGGAPALTDPRLVFLVLWIVIPFVFFSLSQSKRPHYILPIFPALALLVAWRWTASGERLPGLRTTCALSTLFGALLIAAPEVPKLHAKMPPALATSITILATSLGALMLIGAAVAYFYRGSIWLRAVALALPMLVIPIVALPLLRDIGQSRSMEQPIAVHPEIWKGAPITFVRNYLPSVSFYARRTVTLVTEDADELRSNYAVRHADTWLGHPGFALEPWSVWRAAPPSGDPRAIFIAKARDTEVRRILDRDCSLLKETGGVAIYRSCGASGTLAPDAGVR